MYEKRGAKSTTDKLNKPANDLSTDTAVMRDLSSRPTSAAPKSKLRSQHPVRPQRLSSEAEAEAQRRREKKRKQALKRRLMLFAILLFFLFAIAGLIFAIVFALNSCTPTDEPNILPSDPISGSAIPQQATPKPQVADDFMLPSNTTVAGISIGSMTANEAKSVLLSSLPPVNVDITLRADGLFDLLDTAMVGASWDIDSTVALASAGGSVNPIIAYDPATLQASLDEINSYIPSHPIDATFSIDYDSDGKPQFVYVEGESGMKIDFEGVKAEIAQRLSQGESSFTITPSIVASPPAVTADMLREQTAFLSSYTTSYRFKGTTSMSAEEKENSAARDVNILKAAQMMHCIQLAPGKSWSFNDATGNRNEKNGWALANAVFKDSYRKEPGGGVCQISTTMFNALIRANVGIVKRKGHSIPSDYVTKNYEDGLGLDATVDYGNIDFKFRNTTEGTLYVFVYCTVNKSSSGRRDINVEVYGNAFPKGVEYRVRNEIIKHEISTEIEYQVDKKQPFDYDVKVREAHDYYLVMAYVDKYIDGVYQGNVMKFESEYKMINEKHIVGQATPPPIGGGSGGSGGSGGGDPQIPIMP